MQRASLRLVKELPFPGDAVFLFEEQGHCKPQITSIPLHDGH